MSKFRARSFGHPRANSTACVIRFMNRCPRRFSVAIISSQNHDIGVAQFGIASNLLLGMKRCLQSGCDHLLEKVGR